MTLDILNIGSSIFGLAGTWLIFKFGIPSRIDTGGHGVMIVEQADEKEIKEIARYKSNGNIGLFLVLQFNYQLDLV